MSVQYSLFTLRAKKHELEKKLHFGEQEGWLDKTEKEYIESQLKSLDEGIEVLEKHFKSR